MPWSFSIEYALKTVSGETESCADRDLTEGSGSPSWSRPPLIAATISSTKALYLGPDGAFCSVMLFVSISSLSCAIPYCIASQSYHIKFEKQSFL